jgi:hypothetical protein
MAEQRGISGTNASKLKDLESLYRGACSERNIPQALMAKCERRVRDYMWSYRMGVDSHGLEKPRAVIKSHRKMLDSYESFIKRKATDDTMMPIATF